MSDTPEVPASARHATTEELKAAAIEAGDSTVENFDVMEAEYQYAALVLLTCRWFRRLWVLQEIRKARRTVFFLDDIQFSTEMISSMVWWLEDNLEKPPVGTTVYTKVMSVWKSSIKHIRSLLGCTESAHEDKNGLSKSGC